MRSRIGVIPVVALASLAGCSQSEAPPPPATTTARVTQLGQQPGKASLSALTVIVREETDPAARREAVYVLADIGSEADAATIAEALRDPDERVRNAAIDALSTMGGETPPALLVAALQDVNPRVRLRAVDAFGDIAGPVASLALQQALSDPDVLIREAAAELLAERNAEGQ